MKTSVSLSLFEGTKQTPILFRNNIEENIPKIKELGYDGVDLFVFDPYDDVSIRAKELLKKNNLGVGVVMPAALAGEGLFLGHVDEENRKEIIIRMKEIIEYTSDFDGAMVSLGLVRGSVTEDGDTSEKLLARFADSVEQILPFAKERGVDLVLEPINRYEINTLCESMESYDFIKKSGLDIYLMLDTFHMNIEDVSITKSLEYCKDRIKHIHFVDSNRLAPSMGHIDMKSVYETLKKVGYNGYLCLETLQGEDYIHTAQMGMKCFADIGLK